MNKSKTEQTRVVYPQIAYFSKNNVESFASCELLSNEEPFQGYANLPFKEELCSHLAQPNCEFLLQNINLFDAVSSLYSPFTSPSPDFSWVAFHRFSALEHRQCQQMLNYQWLSTELVIQIIPNLLVSIYFCRHWLLGSNQCNDLFCKMC